MERRLFIFFILSLCIWTSYLALQLYISPPRPPAQAKNGGKADAKKADAEKTDAPQKVEAKTPEVDAVVVKEDASAVATVPRERVSLGSLDPKSQFRMLVTLDNRGAAVERVELNGPHYHDLDDLSGYLGHLAIGEEKAGLRINVVGAGTPAALAKGATGEKGLQPQDLITALDKQPMKRVIDFTRYLENKTKPGQTVELSVFRGEGDAKKQIVFTATLIKRPLELIRPEVNSKATPVDPQDLATLRTNASYRTTLVQLGEDTLSAHDVELAELTSLYFTEWKVVEHSPAAVTFETTVERKQDDKSTELLQVRKRYQLAQSEQELAGYHLNYELEIKNLSASPQKVAYRQEGPNGLPLEGWWYTNKVGPGWGAVGARDIAYFAGSHQLVGLPKLASEADKQVKANNPPTLDLLLGNKARDMAYLAVDTQFFAAGLLPATALESEVGKLPTFPVAAAYGMPMNKVVDKHWSKTTNTTFFIDSEPQEIAAGGTVTHKYILFAGPKDPNVLAPYHLSSLIEYGWFGLVSKALLGVLNLLYYLTSNYGISIVLLTVFVRLGLLPFSIRQAKSAALMQSLAPEIAKLKEKYTDPVEQAQAQRELFAKHGFNPMGGCLLMFAQLPIFIGLYRCLSVDIELREAALIPSIHWCSNLAGPDQLFRWKEMLWPYFSDEGTGWLGPYCNILPLFTIVLFVVQQKLFTPPATDEEQKMQQNIMMFMTMFMGVLFYKVPAGLCIYFITSSLWGIAERKLLPKPAAKPLAPVDVTPTPPRDSKPTDKPSPAANLLSSILGMADAELKSSKKTTKRR